MISASYVSTTKTSKHNMTDIMFGMLYTHICNVIEYTTINAYAQYDDVEDDMENIEWYMEYIQSMITSSSDDITPQQKIAIDKLQTDYNTLYREMYCAKGALECVSDELYQFLASSKAVTVL